MFLYTGSSNSSIFRCRFFAQLEGLSLACLVGLLLCMKWGFLGRVRGFFILKGPACLSDTGPCRPLIQSGRDQWIADRPKWPRITPPLSDGYPTAIRRLSDGYPTVIRRLSDGIRRYPTPGPRRHSVLGAPAQLSDGCPTAIRRPSDGYPTAIRRPSAIRRLSDVNPKLVCSPKAPNKKPARNLLRPRGPASAQGPET